MTRTSARALHRALALVLLLACAAALLPAAPAAADGPVTMRVRPGFDGRARAGHWTPVVVDVENLGPNLTAELAVNGDSGMMRGPSPGYRTEYTVEAALPQGARKQFTLYAPLTGTSSYVAVRLLHDGEVVAEAEGQYTRVAENEVLVGVLAGNPNVAAALPSRGVLGPGRQWTLVNLTEPDVPTLSHALDAFDLLIIGDFVTQQLRAEQLAALEEWVERGGMLALFGGAEARRSLGGLPPSLLPLTLEGSAPLVQASALEAMGGHILPAGQPVTVATGSAAAGRTLLAQDGRPLAVLAGRGEGRVLFLAFDPSLDPLVDWAGLAPLWRELLAAAAPELLLSERRASGMLGTPAAVSSISAFAPRSSNIVAALSNMPALDLPSVDLLAGILAGYVLLVGPVNYIILRRLRRRAWSWITIPLLVAVFSTGTFLLAFRNKGGDVLTSTINLLHLHPASSRARVESYIGVFAPSETTYQLQLPAGAPVTSLGGQEYSYRGVPPGVPNDQPVGVRVQQESGAVDLVGMSMWSMRSVGTEYSTTLPGGLETEARIVGGKLTATVRNTTGLHLSESYLIAGDSYAEIGELAAGASKTVEIADVATATSGFGSSTSVFQMYDVGVGHTLSDVEIRERMRKQSVLYAVLMDPETGAVMVNNENPILVFGWTDGLPSAVTVNQQAAQGPSLTAVMAPVSLQMQGAYELPAGLLTGALVEVSNAAPYQAVPGGLQFAEGAATYQFTLPLEADSPPRQLEAAIPMSGSLLTYTAPFEAAFYNWRTGDWDTATVAADTSVATQAGASLSMGKPLPPRMMRGMVMPATASYMAPPSGSVQLYLATPAGAAADYVGPSGGVRLKITKTNRDTVFVGTVSLALEGGA